MEHKLPCQPDLQLAFKNPRLPSPATWWVCAYAWLVTGCFGDSATSPTPTANKPTQTFELYDSSKDTNSDPNGGAIRLTDRASTVGLNFQYYNDVVAKQLNLPETIGGGVAAFDYDLDGWCDVYFANGSKIATDDSSERFHDALFRNRDGTFSPLSGAATIDEPNFTMGCSGGDVNEDGFEDVFVANKEGGRLLLNQGDGTFVTQKECFRREGDELWNAPLIVDVNRDGHVDLLLANYGHWGPDLPRPSYSYGLGYPRPESLESGSVLIFENSGNGMFIESPPERGFQGATKCLGVAAVDLNKDLFPEIYLANDGIANLMFHRDAIGHWKDIAETTGVAFGLDGAMEASMCVTAFDFGRRGEVDLYITNYIATKNTLYSNSGNLKFRDISELVRNDVIGRPYVGWGTVPIDFDLDGWIDLLIANGHIVSPSATNFRMPNQLAQNVEGVLYDVSARSGDFFRNSANGRSVATLDYNNDRIMEAAITYTDAPVSLVVNEGLPRHNGLCVEVFDPQQRTLVGGRLEIVIDGQTTAIPMVAGGSYLSESQKRWTIGLGESVGPIELRVYWPDGQIDHWPAVETDFILRLTKQRLWRVPPFRKP